MIKGVISTAFLLVCILYSGAMAEESKKASSETKQATSQLTQVFEFVKKNVIGKTLVSPEETYTIDNGKMEAVFGAESSYSNLNMTDEKTGKDVRKGFVYDEKTNIKLTNYKLDPKGKRIEPGENRDRETWRRYFITQRKSTGELFGVSLSLNENGEIKNSPYTGVFKIEIKEGKLVREYKQLYYNDCYSTDSEAGYRPCASESTEEIFMDSKGKVQRMVTINSYNVDPVTLERTPEKVSPVKTLVSREK